MRERDRDGTWFHGFVERTMTAASSFSNSVRVSIEDSCPRRQLNVVIRDLGRNYYEVVICGNDVDADRPPIPPPSFRQSVIIIPVFLQICVRGPPHGTLVSRSPVRRSFITIGLAAEWTSHRSTIVRIDNELDTDICAWTIISRPFPTNSIPHPNLPATQINAPAQNVATLTTNLILCFLYASHPPSSWYASYSQNAPAIPYVYHDANNEAAILTMYAKIGTPTANTNAAPFMITINTVQVPHPKTVCSWICLRRFLNNLMKNNFAAV